MKKIVLIEGDEQFGNSIKAYLTNQGYAVEHVNRPCAVANTIRTFCPDIVITDQLLPGTQGRNIPFSLRQLNEPSFKLLLLSQACSDIQRELFDNGLIDGCFDRGADLGRLRDTIESC
jgi:two-component system, OmpR family, response regulator RstA